MINSQTYLSKLIEILESESKEKEKNINNSNYDDIVYKAYYGYIDINEFRSLKNKK